MNCCSVSLPSQINGRTLKEALEERALQESYQRFKFFKDTEWVSVCPACDERFLRGTGVLWPFQCHDGVMRTVDDFSRSQNAYTSESLSFAYFRFTRSALNNAIILQKRQQRTRDTEEAGKRLLQAIASGTATDDDFYSFSASVHVWGRGERVWGKLMKQPTSELRNELRTWLSDAPFVETRDAIAQGANIKGLGVSFASKHLRMLCPERFAVLDDVLSQGLGFALNSRGYEFFMKQLAEFQSEILPGESIAFIEAGLFLLVRQGVRAVN